MINVSVNNTSSFNNPPATFKSTSAKIKSASAPHIQAALAAIQGLNLKVEICGLWVWIFNGNA